MTTAGGPPPAGPGPTAPANPPTPPGTGYPHHLPHPMSWSDLHHVCHGDPDSPDKGGHLHGTGRPGKTEFPAGWDDQRIRAALSSAATHPDSTVLRPNGVWYATAVHDGVTVIAVVRPDGGISAGWPRSGPGVHRNPPGPRRRP